MKLALLGLAAILILCVAGCEHDAFEIEIRPDGSAFHRRLTGWHAGQNQPKQLPAAEIQRLAKLYPQRESGENAAKQIFSGRFVARTPADVGGTGVYTSFTSPMGGTSSYLERFRGNDDLESDLAQRRQAADQLTSLLIGWLTVELGHDPGFPQLKKFLDEDFRNDLKNVGVYAWSGSETGELERMTEFLARAGLYLSDRGYFSPQQLPTLSQGVFRHDPAPLLAHIQRLFARKMGLPDTGPIPQSLTFLGDPARLTLSLTNYVRSTELFKERVAAWNAAKGKPDLKEPTPDTLLGELASKTIAGHNSGFGLLLGGDTLDLTLVCRQKPYAGNGSWNEATGTVKWSHPMSPMRTLPVLCFALWSTPDSEFQTQHFGRIILEDGELAQYVLWYRGLKPDEADQWDRFLTGLEPKGNIAAALQAFRFAGEHGPIAGQPVSLADTPRELLLSKLALPNNKTNGKRPR
jgi:hypothetical protein